MNIKKGIRLITLGATGIFFILTIGLMCIHFWLSVKWKDFYTEQEMKAMALQIESARILPENFYMTYDKVYPESRNISIGQMTLKVIGHLLTLNESEIQSARPCNCLVASYYFDNKLPMRYHGWSSYILTYGLENYTSPSKCLDFLYEQLQIRSLANQYFSKNIDELTERQNLELILRMKRQKFYDENPALLAKELKSYEFKL